MKKNRREFLGSSLALGLVPLIESNPIKNLIGSEENDDKLKILILGGTSFSGGIGGVVGTVIGVLFIRVLNNGLGIAGIESFWQGVITGVILILAVLFDKFQTR